MTKAVLFVFAIVMGLIGSGSAGAVICTVPATATGSWKSEYGGEYPVNSLHNY